MSQPSTSIVPALGSRTPSSIDSVVDQGAPAELIERYGRGTMEEVFLDIARGTSGTGGEPPVGAAAEEVMP